MADTDKLLETLAAMRDESRERGKQTAERFDKLDSRLDNMDRTDSIIQGEVHLLGTRIGTLESRVARIDSDHQQTKRTSIQGDEAQSAALVSAMDIHGKALAQHRAETNSRLDSQDRTLEQLTQMQAQQTAILTRLDAIAANPTVRRVAYAIGSIIVAYAAAKGLVLK